MNDPLIAENYINGEPAANVLYKCTTVYQKALEYFKQGQVILAIYSFVKFCVSVTLVCLNNLLNTCDGTSKYMEYGKEVDGWGEEYLPIWMYLISKWFLVLICQKKLFIVSLLFIYVEENNRQVYDSLGHGIAIEIPDELQDQNEIDTFIEEEYENQNQILIERMDLEGPLEESRKVSLLAMDIKKKVQSFSWVGKYIGKSCFILFQMLEFWGLIFYFSNYAVTVKGCDDMYTKFLFVILFLGMYQYLDIYIMFVLVVLFLPLLVFYSIYEWFKDYMRRRREFRRINDIIHEVSYVDNLTKGTNECAICMQQYLKAERVVILPCSDKHHFHSACIRSWFNINSKCPLCRNNIIGQEDNNQNE